ncbi:MAG TPA: hypothetical protein PKW15_00550 [Alphaproteobacteria bacterium]|nr:hypothetical protein [Rhodospirillaceae bacterium]HRJ11712.1 hypothetical protein [Alphaproteobacteria bacterium]
MFEFDSHKFRILRWQNEMDSVSPVQELTAWPDNIRDFKLLLPGGAMPTEPTILAGDALRLHQFLESRTGSGLSPVFLSPENDAKRISYWRRLGWDCWGPGSDVIMIAAKDLDDSVSVGVGMNAAPQDYRNPAWNDLFESMITHYDMLNGTAFLPAILAVSAGTSHAELFSQQLQRMMVNADELDDPQIASHIGRIPACFICPITVRMHWQIGNPYETMMPSNFLTYYAPSLLKIEGFYTDRRDWHAQAYRERFEHDNPDLLICSDPDTPRSIMQLPRVNPACDAQYRRSDPHYHSPHIFREVLQSRWRPQQLRALRQLAPPVIPGGLDL